VAHRDVSLKGSRCGCLTIVGWRIRSRYLLFHRWITTVPQTNGCTVLVSIDVHNKPLTMNKKTKLMSVPPHYIMIVNRPRTDHRCCSKCGYRSVRFGYNRLLMCANKVCLQRGIADKRVTTSTFAKRLTWTFIGVRYATRGR
jgi:hypothetical protein